MSKKKIKIIIPIFIILIIGFVILDVINYLKQDNKQTTKFYFMNNYITISLYDVNKDESDKTLKKIKSIYKEYDRLSDRYNNYEGINNLYYIIYNNSKNDEIEIDEKLYKMLEEGKKWYQESDGLIDISIGSVLDIWKMYRDSTSGIPSKFELERAHVYTIDDIILLGNNKIKNNHVSIDLDVIAKGYATEEVVEYLNKNKINKYLINIDGSVITGDHYDNNDYKIAIENPTEDEYKILYGNNINVINTNVNQNYYDYNNKHYHDIISPKTLMPVDYFKGVTIITDNIKDSFVISKLLFLMPIDEGKKYVKSYDDLEAIWYIEKDETQKSDNFNEYE